MDTITKSKQKLNGSRLTPPESPKWKAHTALILPNHDEETSGLIGSTRFEPRPDVKSILVTGGAGFIGSWVTRHLVLQYPEYNIVCFDKLDYVSSMANIKCLKPYPNFHFVQGDITSGDAIDQALSDWDIDCIMHFAACSHVQNSFHDQNSFTLNNVIGTQKLLDSARRHGRINRFIHVSTDEVYGETPDDFVDESKQFLPTNPYSASKAAAEMYVYAYYKSFNLPIVVVRSNNVFGPCQYPEKIIPRFYTLLSKNQPITIQGSGLHKRRYLYGGDAADGFDTILHKGIIGEAYNIESGHGVTNIEVAVRMLQLFGCDPQTDFATRLVWIQDRPFNDHDYCVDGSKLKGLGWKQKTPFDAGLKITMDWYKSHLNTWWSNETVSDISVQTPAAEKPYQQDPIALEGAKVKVVIGSV